MKDKAADVLLLGGHRALDFLNTWRNPGVEVETLVDGAAFGAWLTGAGLLPEAELAKLRRKFGEAGLDAAAAEARRFREWTREWLGRWRVAPAGRFERELEVLNKLLAREERERQLVRGSTGLEIREVPRFPTTGALVALVAAEVADLVAREDAALVRECDGDCTLWFIDRTRSHRRVYCSPALCGNRAKVAAFRERQRE